MKYVLLAAAVAGLSACSGDNAAVGPDQDVLMHNDFESTVGWVPDATAPSAEQAHSGRYSLKVDAAHPYSLTYYSLLGKLSASRIRGLRVEGWAYTPNPAASASVGLRVGINDAPGGKLLLGDGIAYGEQVKEAGKWTKISKEITLGPTVNYSSQLVIYLWSGGTGPGAGPAYLDDISVTALR